MIKRFRRNQIVRFLIFILLPSALFLSIVAPMWADYPTPRPLPIMLTERPTTEPQRVQFHPSPTPLFAFPTAQIITKTPTNTPVVEATLEGTSIDYGGEERDEAVTTPEPTDEARPEKSQPERNRTTFIRSVIVTTLALTTLIGSVIYLWRRNK